MHGSRFGFSNRCQINGPGLEPAQALVERLDRPDVTELGIDTDTIGYRQLAELDTATDRARRDAPAITVCEL